MRRITYFLLSTLLVSGCDFFNNTRICNQTGQDIHVIIKFDTEYARTVSGMSPGELARKFHVVKKNLTFVEADTINAVIKYLIKRDLCGQIESGNNKRPHFSIFERIDIITATDTLTLDSKEKMRKAFDADRKKPEYYFDLVME